jgi:hypothetical protein
VEKKEELDATVIDEFRAGLTASIAVAEMVTQFTNSMPIQYMDNDHRYRPPHALWHISRRRSNGDGCTYRTAPQQHSFLCAWAFVTLCSALPPTTNHTPPLPPTMPRCPQACFIAQRRVNQRISASCSPRCRCSRSRSCHAAAEEHSQRHSSRARHDEDMEDSCHRPNSRILTNLTQIFCIDSRTRCECARHRRARGDFRR